jgi:hypothetical protein
MLPARRFGARAQQLRTQARARAVVRIMVVLQAGPTASEAGRPGTRRGNPAPVRVNLRPANGPRRGCRWPYHLLLVAWRNVISRCACHCAPRRACPRPGRSPADAKAPIECPPARRRRRRLSVWHLCHCQRAPVTRQWASGRPPARRQGSAPGQLGNARRWGSILARRLYWKRNGTQG